MKTAVCCWSIHAALVLTHFNQKQIGARMYRGQGDKQRASENVDPSNNTDTKLTSSRNSLPLA